MLTHDFRACQRKSRQDRLTEAGLNGPSVILSREGWKEGGAEGEESRRLANDYNDLAVIQRIRRLFSRRPTPFPNLGPVSLRPIGVVRNGVKEPQPDGWQDVTSRLIIRPELAEALLGIDTFSHVVVLFWPHLIPEQVRGSKPRLHPRDDPQNPLQGVLATRSQIRFNPILMTAVPLLGVKKNVLKVRGLDALDGSPVLDVKPYIPHFDSVSEAKVPAWITATSKRSSRSS